MSFNEIFEQPWQAAGYTAQTAIQSAVEKPLISGESVVAIAPTGSGKTLAYALPLMSLVQPTAGIQLMIVAPSQELVIQIRDVITPFAKAANLKVQGIIGAANVKRQIDKLKEKPEIIVGTLGRVSELVDAKKIKVQHLQTLVVDEADDMLTEPTLSDLRALFQRLPAECQLACFSATKAPIMDDLMTWFGITPQQIDVTDADHTQGEVDHYYLSVPIRKKTDWLRRFAINQGTPALVFFNQLATLEQTAQTLKYENLNLATLTSDQRQTSRQQALSGFKQGKVQLLLTTDVAGRGIDIDNLPVVINFDLPLYKNTYIHRVGRTGRMGNKGTVINLGNDREFRSLKQLMRDNYDIRPIYYAAGELTLDKPEEAPVHVHSTSSKTKVPNKPMTPAKSKVSNKSAEPKKPTHKKIRKRDQKNKGKHKNKG